MTFPTSLRRDPGDPRRLLERIDAQLKERIEEACELFCLDLLVQLRDARRRPAPQPDNQQDRHEFRQLVQEFMAALNTESRGWVPRGHTLPQTKLIEQQPLDEPLELQVFLAKTLPDYWQRLEQSTQAFSKVRLNESRPPRNFLDRLLNVKREE